jgi:hypothetical protein
MPRWSGGGASRCGSPRRPSPHGMRRRRVFAVVSRMPIHTMHHAVAAPPTVDLTKSQYSHVRHFKLQAQKPSLVCPSCSA